MSPSTRPVIIPAGFLCDALAASPLAIAPSRTKTEMTLTRRSTCGTGFVDALLRDLVLGISDVLLGIARLERLDVLHDVVKRDTDGRRVGEQSLDERFQLALTISARAAGRRGGYSSNERADTALRGKQAGAFQLGVDLRHGIGVDPQVDRQLSHRRQLISDAESPGSDRRSDTAVELRIDRRGVGWIDGEHSVSLY